VLNRDISIKFISTNDQVADVFTKGLSTDWFMLIKSKLFLISSPLSFSGDVKPIENAIEHESRRETVTWNKATATSR